MKNPNSLPDLPAKNKKIKKKVEKKNEKIPILKKEKKLNDESFIDAYFISRAKSVRCWTRKKKMEKTILQNWFEELKFLYLDATLVGLN